MAEKNQNQLQIQAWFNSLTIVEHTAAVKMLTLDDPVRTIVAGIKGYTSRATALVALAEAARLLPADHHPIYNNHRLIILNKDGYPIYLKTKKV